jgi:uncharacterized membrane protein
MRSGAVRSGATGLLAVALMLLSSAAFVVPDTKGVISGGIIPCSGLDLPNGPHYSAGAVTVLKGRVTWRTTPQGNVQDVLPTGVVAQQSVATNENYRFVLNPGSYVLQAGISYTSVTLQPGVDVNLDVPNMCI